MNEFKNVGGFGAVAYFLFVCGLYAFVQAMILGGHLNDDGEWVTFKDGLNSALICFVIGLVFFIIDKMRNKKANK